MHPPLTTRQPPRKQKVCGSVKAIMDELTTQMRNGNPDGPIPRHILAWQSKVGFLVRPALFQTRLCAPGVLRCCVPRAACTHYTCHTHVCASLPGMCLHMMHRPCLVLSVWYPSVHMFSAFRVYVQRIPCGKTHSRKHRMHCSGSTYTVLCCMHVHASFGFAGLAQGHARNPSLLPHLDGSTHLGCLSSWLRVFAVLCSAALDGALHHQSD